MPTHMFPVLPAYTGNSLLNNARILDTNGALLYDVVTPPTGLFESRRPTTIFRAGPTGLVQVAVLEWHSLSDNIVSFQDALPAPMDAFLFSSGMFSRSREMFTPIGEFKWKESGGKPELYDTSGQLVACWHRAHLNIFSRKPPESPKLEIDAHVVAVLDHVIVGFLIMYHIIELRRRRRRNNSTNGTGARAGVTAGM